MNNVECRIRCLELAIQQSTNGDEDLIEIAGKFHNFLNENKSQTVVTQDMVKDILDRHDHTLSARELALMLFKGDI